jgi:hypothetical protein
VAIRVATVDLAVGPVVSPVAGPRVPVPSVARIVVPDVARAAGVTGRIAATGRRLAVGRSTGAAAIVMPPGRAVRGAITTLATVGRPGVHSMIVVPGVARVIGRPGKSVVARIGTAGRSSAAIVPGHVANGRTAVGAARA